MDGLVSMIVLTVGGEEGEERMGERPVSYWSQEAWRAEARLSSRVENLSI